MKRILLSFILAVAGFVTQSHGAGLIIIDSPDEEAVVLPTPDHPRQHWEPRQILRYTSLEIQSLKASVTIQDQVASTRIEEEFYNPNPRRLEGTFLFPLPRGAHLEKFRMEVNGKMVDAELLAADKAKSIYEEIVRKAKDPALLEFVGQDLLKVRIFPIEPNSTKRVELSYRELLKSDVGLVGYTLPVSTAKYCARPPKSVSLKIDLQTTTALKTVYSPSHTAEIARKDTHRATLGLEQKEASVAARDFQLFYSSDKAEFGLNFLTYRNAGEDGYFMLLAAPGIDGDKNKILPKDVVFVTDTSGSMAGAKMEQARKALLFCIENLNEQDRFEVIRFSTETEALFNKLTEVSADTRKQAAQFVTNFKPIGGTAIDDALQKSLATHSPDSSRPCIIVFLTDGMPTTGETKEETILKHVTDKTEKRTRIFCFGVGTDVNTRLLDRIAEETSAASQYVLPEEDLEVKVSSFFSKISDPVMTEVQIDYGRIHATKVHPGKLPDLFKGQQLIALGRYSGEGSTTVKLTGKVGEDRKEFSYKLTFPAESQEHDFIARLWATRRVGHLLDEIRLHGENHELQEEVTQLAKKYQIATPYTSFLITEDQPIPVRLVDASAAAHPEARYGRNVQATKRSSSAPSTTFPQARENERLALAAPLASGDAAVAGARYRDALKNVLSEQELQLAPVEVQHFAQSGTLAAKPAARELARNPFRMVHEKAFRFEDGVWVEVSAKDSVAKAKPIRIEFDSKEYWDLLAQHPELKDILALGQNVQFALGSKVYQIFSQTK